MSTSLSKWHLGKLALALAVVGGLAAGGPAFAEDEESLSRDLVPSQKPLYTLGKGHGGGQFAIEAWVDHADLTYRIGQHLKIYVRPKHTAYITVLPELLVLSSTGAGDLAMSGPDDPPGTTEGFMLLSTVPSAILGGGPFLGLEFDPLMLQILNLPATPCDLLHWIPAPGCWPNVNLSFPPGSIPPSSLTIDAVVLQVVPPAIVVSNVARVSL